MRGKWIGLAFGLSGLFLLAWIPAIRSQTPRPDRPSKAARAGGPAAAAMRFDDTITQSGIDFTLENSRSAMRYSIETMAGGVAIFDYDNDGRDDIYFTNGAAIPSLEKTGPRYYNRLYRNNGDGTYTDVTRRAGLEGAGYSMGVATGDYDNDGFVDLYVAGVNRNQLMHNNGDGTFTDVIATAGVEGLLANHSKAWSVAAGWFDYNQDGLLDLLVVNYLDYNIKTAPACQFEALTIYCSPNDFHGTPNILYRNNGDGTFTDVSQSSHIGRYIGKGMAVAFADYDNDGRTDIFISNDTFPNYLLHNNRDGTFTDVALVAGAAFTGSGKVVAGMGADFRDLNNDGLPDIFHTAMFGDTFPLYKNLGHGQFEDSTYSAGMAPTGTLTGWSAGAFDFDNDGYKDLFTANAAILDNAMEVQHRPYELGTSLLRNRGDFTFEDISAKAGADLSAQAAHRGAAFGDLNNDGKVDIVTTVLNGRPQILMNHTLDANHWIALRLVGSKSNRDGLGTKVRITTIQGSQYNAATTAVGYGSASDKRIFFGLGKATVAESIALDWPGGSRQVLRQVKADQILTIEEPR